ncbi:MAG TPA: hypothetical protein VHZ95_16410, partial [Polyangiales bacterium]|nr:hypothetical protein [Polyangiales bacterium]
MSASPEAEPNDSYDVVVLAFEARDEAPAAALQRVFGVERATAEALVRDLPAVVRRGVNAVRAEYFRKALVSIGAQVEVRAFGLPLMAAESAPEPSLAAIELPANAQARASDADGSGWGDLQARLPANDSRRQLQPAIPRRARHEELDLDAGQLALAHSPSHLDSEIDAAQLALASLPAM